MTTFSICKGRKGTLLLAFSCILLSACLNTNEDRAVTVVAIAVVFDPTTELDMNSVPGAGNTSFQDQIRSTVRDRIVSKLQPNDDLACVSVTDNAPQVSNTLLFDLPPDRTSKEKKKFLESREQAKITVDKWFETLRDSPPCKDPRKPCSDIWGAMLLAADALRRSDNKGKLMIVFSDMQENIRKSSSLPPASLANIDVVVLFAFPRSKRPTDYEPFRLELLKVVNTANPRSARVLFPAEAPTFNYEEAVGELRRPLK